MIWSLRWSTKPSRSRAGRGVLPGDLHRVAADLCALKDSTPGLGRLGPLSSGGSHAAAQYFEARACPASAIAERAECGRVGLGWRIPPVRRESFYQSAVGVELIQVVEAVFPGCVFRGQSVHKGNHRVGLAIQVQSQI